MAPSFADGHSKMYAPLNLKPDNHVLEVGVGTGVSLKHYPAFVKVEAIDYSEPMLVKARKRMEKGEVDADVNIQQMDAHNLEFTKSQGLIVIVNHYKEKKGIIGGAWNPFRKRLGLGKHVNFKELIEECGLELVSEERVNRIDTHSRMLVCQVP